MSNNKSHNTVRALIEGATMVAYAEGLGLIKIGHLPNGGSISLMMLPIILYALRWGLGRGLLAGLALGLLDIVAGDGFIAIGWQSVIGDYVAACTLIGLAGVGPVRQEQRGVRERHSFPADAAQVKTQRRRLPDRSGAL